MLIAGTERNIEAAVLAGGENRRFDGKIKAKMRVGSKSIIRNTLDILDSVFTSTLIVTNYSSEFDFLGDYPMVEDIYKKVGPLGGIHSALANSRAEALFIVAGDMPGLSEFFIRQMAEYYFVSDCEVLIPRIGKNIEPLHSVYSRDILERLSTYLSSSSSYAIRDFLKEVKVEYLDITDHELQDSAFTNINTPGDLQKARIDLKKNNTTNKWI